MLKPLVNCIVVLLLSCATLVAGGDDALLLEAAKRGDDRAVVGLLEHGADANAEAPDGTNALHWATHLDDLEMAQRLIRAGTDVNHVN